MCNWGTSSGKPIQQTCRWRVGAASQPIKTAIGIILAMTLAQLVHANILEMRIPGGTSGYHGLTPEQRAAQAAMYAAIRRQEEMQEAEFLRQQQAQKAAEAAREQQIQDKLNELQQDANEKAESAASAELSLNRLMESIVADKKLIPKDPWRLVSGTKKYVKSFRSGFVKYDGLVLQTTTNGILVEGNCGNVGTNFFVENFPYGDSYTEGDRLPARKPYVALPDGFFTYINIDGSIQSIPKLNYEKPCSPPRNAHVIETAAQHFTPDEQQEIGRAKRELEQKRAEAKSAAAQFRRFSQQVEAEKEAAIQAKNAPALRALKYNQTLADKGDPYGLLRMGERYRDGDGVPKNLAKAREYLEKAVKAGDPTAASELAALGHSSIARDSNTSK